MSGAIQEGTEMVALFILILISAIVLLLVIIGKANGKKNEVRYKLGTRTIRCPYCGSPANVSGNHWECPFCGDSGVC